MNLKRPHKLSTHVLLAEQKMLAKIIIAAAAVGLAAAQSGSNTSNLPDCECKPSWTHNECE